MRLIHRMSPQAIDNCPNWMCLNPIHENRAAHELARLREPVEKSLVDPRHSETIQKTDFGSSYMISSKRDFWLGIISESPLVRKQCGTLRSFALKSN
jgi:hypothetical protein